MTKEKQIDEMAVEFAKINCNPKGCYSCNLCDEYGSLELSCEDYVFYRKMAETFYTAGYRKQSEGEWIDQYNGKYANPIYVCSVCGKGTLLKPHINDLGNMEMIQALSLFCPHCRAKMKGGAE